MMPPISRHFKFRFLVFEVVLTMRPLSKLRMRVFKSILVLKLRRMMSLSLLLMMRKQAQVPRYPGVSHLRMMKL